jgi:hypothetical protein
MEGLEFSGSIIHAAALKEDEEAIDEDELFRVSKEGERNVSVV